MKKAENCKNRTNIIKKPELLHSGFQNIVVGKNKPYEMRIGSFVELRGVL